MKIRNSDAQWRTRGKRFAPFVFVALFWTAVAGGQAQPTDGQNTALAVKPGSTLQDPSSFLGYAMGSRFTFHHEVVDYLRYLALNTPHAKEVEYGNTYEGRPLQALIVASPAHYQELDAIRTDHLKRMEGERGDARWDDLAVVWLSYGVHGNEAVCTESALEVMYRACSATPTHFPEWHAALKNLVVIIDPCLNPDGHDRYVSFFSNRASAWPNADPQSWEHEEPWPGGRVNHYLFDLNRDWAWVQQRESANRMTLMLNWMPHVHGDFHEMGIDSPYYFAPAAKPYHRVITDWQRVFQEHVGTTTANHFDRRGALFYTGEDFDLYYPSYGDTYPMYHGAIGLTYEQGGSARAGVLVENSDGDEVSLAFRIENHVESSLALLETSATHANTLRDSFAEYHRRNRENPWGTYKSYVISGRNAPAQREALQAFLRLHRIEFGPLKSTPKKGSRAFGYQQAREVEFTAHPEDWVIPASQTHGAFLQVLFDPHEMPEDSSTYDVTGWAIPFAWGLEAFAFESALPVGLQQSIAVAPVWPGESGAALGFAFVPAATRDQRVVAQWLRAGLRLRYSDAPSTFSGRYLPAGSYVCLRSDQRPALTSEEFEQAVRRGWEGSMSPLTALKSTRAEQGFDLGSEHWKTLSAPAVAVLGGPSVSSLNLGEVWWHLEQELGYPVSIINPERISADDLERYQVVVVPAGYYRYGKELASELGDWVSKGGTLLAMGSGLGMLETDVRFGLKKKAGKDTNGDNENPEDQAFANRYRQNLDRAVEGAVYPVTLDKTHPMTQGVTQPYYTLKNASTAYDFLVSGYSVGQIRPPATPVNGFAGHKVGSEIANSLAIGVQPLGDGIVVCFQDNPLFRGFWENGKMLFDNALWGQSAR